jgi:hypothetical protein
MTSRAERALQQMWRLGGMLPWLNRDVLSAVIHDFVEYGIEVWYKESNKTQKEHLRRLQSTGVALDPGCRERYTHLRFYMWSQPSSLCKNAALRLLSYITLPVRWWAWYLADHGRRTPPYTGFSGFWSTTSKILHHRLRIAATPPPPPGGTARGCREKRERNGCDSMQTSRLTSEKC